MVAELVAAVVVGMDMAPLAMAVAPVADCT